MSEPFAHYTAAAFDVLPKAVAIDATGTAYTTPQGARIQIRDMARLSYVGATLRATVRLNQGTAGGSGTVTLTDGANDVDSWAVDFTQGEHQTFRREVDLSGVAGSAGLRLVLEVDGAADGGTTAEVAGVLDIYHPLVLLSGC